ncbi:5-formyltetrahydrofolate cyclo-ligase [Duganella qianjiadongensis]|uniref:5-formyltetrahydrofolate cyclo-ligase n=1 Tax=Duganella qianjiadongensis TaxID=2692176 RepID=A0ABW9VLX3_9BURK|nr:5-formyltetrahydrofolate cyclo-ligase [Duganella qianjiadongensis]MYM40603.1 5-formyltetrahydrofolate cyclo-ligase [Duganella qianjiadongensis]
MTSDPRIPCATTEPLALPAGQKALLRKQLRLRRRAVAAASKAQWDQAIGERLLAWWQAMQPASLGVYWPLKDEPDLHAAYAALAARGARLLLPVVLEKDAPLAFAQWEIGEAMVQDAMGVAVPQDLRLQADYPAALLVPCLGFNEGNYRMGYGGGYYDRTLARTPRPQTLGIAYQCLRAEFAADSHDVALDHIITE